MTYIRKVCFQTNSKVASTLNRMTLLKAQNKDEIRGGNGRCSMQ